jgi:LacI family transcriptional regulator
VTAAERKRGFLEEMGRSGVATSGIPTIEDLHDEEMAYAATLELLGGPDRPTALFTSQNLVTIGAIRALRQLELHRDIALIGFDDIALADLLQPGITVITQNPREIGRLAAERVFARLDGDEQPERTYVVPTHLIIRGSGEIPPHV